MTEPTVSPLVVNLVVGFAAALIGMAKGGIGNALGGLATPILTLVLPPPIAIGLSLPLLLTGDIFATLSHFGKWDGRRVLYTIPGTFIGVVGGSFLLSRLISTPTVIEKLIGGFSLAFCIYKLSETRIRTWLRREVQEQRSTGEGAFSEGRLLTPGFSFLTGLVSTLANAGGPVFAVYLLLLNLQPSTFVATQALYFAILNVMKIPTFLQAGILRTTEIVQFAWAVPILFIAVRIGAWAEHRVNKQTFERLTIAALAIVAVFLLLK